MIIPDLNLLIYAVNGEAAWHQKAKTWWEECVNKGEQIGIAWVVLLGFLRLTTSPRVFPRPLSLKQALDIIETWLERKNIVLLSPGSKHFYLLKTLLLAAGTGGNLTTDAHLAALCLECGGMLYTADNDFRRFAPLKTKNPLAL